MGTTEVRGNDASESASVKNVDMKVEVVVIPVSDVDRAKEFYGSLGWRLDLTPPGVIQFTPHGSGCSVQFGTNLTSAAPGSAKRNSTDVTRRQTMNAHVSGTTLEVGLDQRPGGKGTRVAGKFGLDPHRLDDEALERVLRYLYATREETFFRGTRQALLNHTDRMLQLEHEFASRFPERTRANALRTRKGSRLGQASRPAGRQTVAER